MRAAPSAEAEPRPYELDNPWAKLAALNNNLQAGGTGVFRNPFASDDSSGEGAGARQTGKDHGSAKHSAGRGKGKTS